MLMHGLNEHFGGSLLGDILTSFTDFTPHRDKLKVGRGALDAPRLGAWSPAKSIERGRKGYFRKYLLHCADRGQGIISGRPPTTTSPRDGFSGWFESGRSDAPRRERLPMTAQHFPAIASSGFAASCMKRTDDKESVHDDQSQAPDVRQRHRFGGAPDGEDKPVPFRYGRKPNLFERRTCGFESIHGTSSPPNNPKDTNAGKPLQADAKPFEHNRLEPDTQHKKNSRISLSIVQKRLSGKGTLQSKSRTSTANKLPPNSQTISKLVDDGSHDDRKKGIWTLRLDSTKADRMERITGFRKVKESELLVGERDKVATGEEIEFAQDAFARYFRQKRRFDRERLIEALSDFGIRARTQPEKGFLVKILEEYAEKAEISFRDFCSIVEECRLKFRSCRFSNIFLAWRTVDTDDVGALDVPQVMQLLHLLNVGPTTSTEVAVVESRIDELHKDAFGMYSLGEVEYLSQQCREHIEAGKRRRERRIQEQYDLSAKTFFEFRTQLIPLHDQFKRMDDQDNGEISVEEAMFILSDFGCLMQCPTDVRMEIASGLVSLLENREGAGSLVTFPWFLAFVRSLRKRTIDQQMDNVTMLFNHFDKDRSGELEMKEVCLVIQEMGLLPRSAAEQDGIAELLEEVDVDGSGSLHSEEVMMLVVRISEKIQQIQRESENAKGESLGFSRHQMFELRSAFESLDYDCSGSLTPSEVIRAVKMMEWRVSDAKAMQVYDEVDEDGTGSVEFSEFLILMHKIELDAKTGDDRAATDVEAKQIDHSATVQDEGRIQSRTRRRQITTVGNPVDSKRPEHRRHLSRTTVYRPSA